jgi:hypothetical protein
MSFVMAGGVLLLVLLVGIALDRTDIARRQPARRDFSNLGPW